MYKVLILAQYSENYAAGNDNWNGQSESWKQKGGVNFTMNITDSERMFLNNDEIEEIISEILTEKSNKVSKYAYISHGFINADISDITAEFKNKFAKLVC